jgi:hypothetical protein
VADARASRRCRVQEERAAESHSGSGLVSSKRESTSLENAGEVSSAGTGVSYAAWSASKRRSSARGCSGSKPLGDLLVAVPDDHAVELAQLGHQPREHHTALICDGRAVLGETVLVEHVHARADHEPLRCQAKEEARQAPALLLALPEEEIEVRLVGALVLREAHVAVHAHERAADAGLERDRGRALLERRADRHDELGRRLDPDLLEARLVRVEEDLGVVLLELAEERACPWRTP